MLNKGDVAGYYSRGKLLQRLNAALREDGVDPSAPSLEAPAPYDQFHGRGLEATKELAANLGIAASDHLLDVTGPEPQYPVPWAASAQTSFLSTPEETRRGLERAGFEVVQLAREATANTTRGVAEGRLIPIEIRALR